MRLKNYTFFGLKILYLKKKNSTHEKLELVLREDLWNLIIAGLLCDVN